MKTVLHHPAITKAKCDACRVWPRVAYAVSSLVPYEEPRALSNGHPTMMVDKYYRLYIHPDTLDMDRSQFCWAVLHETCHVVFKHFARGERIFGQMKSWTQAMHSACNIAGDLAINSIFEKVCQENPLIERPKGVVLPADFDLPSGRSFEYYVAELMKQKQQKPPEPPPSGGSSDNEPQEEEDEEDEAPELSGTTTETSDEEGEDGEGNGAGQEGEETGEEAEKDASGSGNGTADEEPCVPGTQGHEGASASGVPRDFELEPPAEENEEEGVTPERADAITSTVANESVKGIGEYGMDQLLDKDFLNDVRGKDKVNPFRRIMDLAVRTITATSSRGTNKRSYRRISRRSHSGIILPTTWKATPSVALIVDTSGSMGREDLHLSAKCVEFILQKWPNPRGILVITGDTRSRAVIKNVRKGEELTFCGGGGTNMGSLVLDTIEKHKPDVVIVATDGYTPWCDKPRVPVVVALTQDGTAPDWATVVKLGQ